MNFHPPKAILIDLDDTLIAYSSGAEECWQEICARYAGEAGQDVRTLLQAVKRSREAYWRDPFRQVRGRLNLKQARRDLAVNALEDLGVSNLLLAYQMADAFSTAREESMQLFPGVISTLQALRTRGFPLGMITNGEFASQRKKIDRHKLGDYFDCILIEGEVGVGKPDAGVYALALQRLGVKPGDAWMVGDNLEWDIQGAQDVGIAGIWVDQAGRDLPEHSLIHPDRTIRTISGLLDLPEIERISSA